MKTIGILGGLGPAASAQFYTTLIDIAQKEYYAVQDADFPKILLYTVSIPDFDETGDLTSAKEPLIQGVKALETMGSELIVIPCNTVHHLYSDMQSAVKVPIVNMIECVARVARKYTTVGLLTSEETKESKLYTLPNALTTTQAEQSLVNEAIRHAMAGLSFDLSPVIDRFITDGAEAILLGCTELPLVVKKANGHPLLSSTEILAHATLQRAYT